ncbi:TPA: hypothetical protein ACXNP2_002493 [Stenotrophomonas maltophilia]
MKIHNVLFGFIAVTIGAMSAIGVVPEAKAAGFQTTCSPLGGGWYQCTEKYCNNDGCVVVNTWSQFFQGDQVIFE